MSSRLGLRLELVPVGENSVLLFSPLKFTISTKEDKQKALSCRQRPSQIARENDGI